MLQRRTDRFKRERLTVFPGVIAGDNDPAVFVYINRLEEDPDELLPIFLIGRITAELFQKEDHLIPGYAMTLSLSPTQGREKSGPLILEISQTRRQPGRDDPAFDRFFDILDAGIDIPQISFESIQRGMIPQIFLGLTDRKISQGLNERIIVDTIGQLADDMILNLFT